MSWPIETPREYTGMVVVGPGFIKSKKQEFSNLKIEMTKKNVNIAFIKLELDKAFEEFYLLYSFSLFINYVYIHGRTQ